MSVAFAFEPGEKKAMQRSAHSIQRERILSKKTIQFIGLVVVVTTTTLLALYAFLLLKGVSIEELRSAMFIAISIDSLFFAFSFRSLSTPLWKIDFRTNRFFLIAFGRGGIRTPGPVKVFCFQDRRIRPLCHSSTQIRDPLYQIS